MKNKSAGLGAMINDEALAPVPLAQRQHWLVPAIIFGGLEFTIPVLMVGATLADSFNIVTIFWLLVVALAIQWIGNSLSGFMGAKSGRASSVIARSSFGAIQARFVIAVFSFIGSMGWWAIQTAVAANAIAAILGINPDSQWFLWAALTTVIGFVFAVPSIIGYSSMKWTDYLAVPAGLILIGAGLYLALNNIGFDAIINAHPKATMTIPMAINLIIGANVAQWLIASDYTRYARPVKKDNVLIPIGIIGIGFPLFLVGAVMSVGVGSSDIVEVMLSLHFPFWGFLILWLATWTSQLVNNYSMGLALSNVFNVNDGRKRALLTFFGTIIAITIALAGIVNYFTEFLNFTVIINTSAFGIMATDFFVISKMQWTEKAGWRWRATLALAAGIAIGALTQYWIPFGIPAIQVPVVSGLIYWLCHRSFVVSR